MRTKTLKAHEITRDWFIADAAGKTLGRFSSQAAQILRGKHKPAFSPHLDMGDFVVVVNADKIKMSGDKESKKEYFKHSGYPGGMSLTDYQQLMKTHPERIVTGSVKGMLPKNRLGRKLMSHLKVYAGEDHPHAAQNPKPLDI